MTQDQSVSQQADVVRFKHAVLDETPHHEIVLRGVLCPESLSLLKIGEYQREVLTRTTLAQLIKAFKTGTVPDIELGMRGEGLTETDGGFVILHDPVFIIDGLQRVMAALRMITGELDEDPEKGESIEQIPSPYLGALVHINTNEEWERRRFRILNMDRTRLSANVLLRNYRHDYPAVDTLYALCRDKSFVLNGRVSWNQQQRRDELLSASTFARTIVRLHAHLSAGGGGRVDIVAGGIQRAGDRIGRSALRDNAKTFFDVIDRAWGVRRIAYRGGAVYVHATFLLALARLFSDHEDFWRGNRLLVEAPIVRKIGSFPTQDPQVGQLSSAAGKAADVLFYMLRDHVNSGRRSKRLKNRFNEYPTTPTAIVDDDEDDGDAEDEAASA